MNTDSALHYSIDQLLRTEEGERYNAEHGSAIADLVFGVDPLDKAVRDIETTRIALDSMVANGRIADYHMMPARLVFAFRLDQHGFIWFKYRVRAACPDGQMCATDFEEKARLSRDHGPHIPRRAVRRFAAGKLGTVEQIVTYHLIKPLDHINITFHVGSNDGCEEIPKEA